MALAHSGEPAPRGPAFLLGAVQGGMKEAREVWAAKLTNEALKSKSPEPEIAASKVWFNLAVTQEARGSVDAAIRSYERALRENPEHQFALLNQALLLVKQGTQPSVKRAEGLLRSAIERNPENPGALWNLGLLLAHQGAPGADVQLAEALMSARRLGWAPRRLAMVLSLSSEALAEYESKLEEEAEQFEDYCSRRQHLMTHPLLRSGLTAALSELRKLPNDPAWLLPWAAETARTFGPDTTAAAYGETLFDSWREVVSDPAVASVMEAQQASAVVLGSALGYQCLFFLAAGLPCTGYDLLQESMVGKAAEVSRRHGLSGEAVHFELGDAAAVPLTGRFRKLGAPTLLWLNDEVWPAELREGVLQRAATELEPGSVIVSYGPEDGPVPQGLELASSLRVPTSWCLAEEIRVLRRLES